MKSSVRATSVVALSLTALLALSSCSEDNKPVESSKPTLTSEGAGKADGGKEVSAKDFAAAEATVTAYFSVKNSADATYKDRIDSQAPFLTDPSVHPNFTSAGVEGPTGLEDTDMKLTLGEGRELAGSIILPFDVILSSESYTLVNGKIDKAQAVGSWSQWTGKATLKEQDGVWLISKFTTDATASGTDNAPQPGKAKPKK